MTYEEAIEMLKYQKYNAAIIEYDATTEMYEIAIKALEKRMPKKPKRYIAFDGIERNGCPACPENEILYAGQKFCSECGQAIDWGESE